MNAVVFSPLAQQDLDEIWESIAQHNLDAADKLIGEFHQAVRLMSQMPGIGHRREDLTDKPLRFWPVRRYLIVYRLEADTLEIVRMLSAYRDVRSLLK